MAQDTGGNNSAQTLIEIIRAYIIDNTTGAVNPAKLRTVLEAIANSVTASSGTAISATPPLNFDAFTNVFSLPVINDLVTGGGNVPLSAEQGVELKKLIDATVKSYIPLTGTESGNPITGDVEFESESGSIKWIDGDGSINQLSFYESGFSFKNNGLDKLIFSNTTQILSLTVDSSNVNPTDKLIFAQRAYCENPETLINALNNCDSTQLNTIKTILGI